MTDSGEVGSLRHANHLLGQRFPRRTRPYLSHGPRVMAKQIHEEVVNAFQGEVDLARSRRFRESTYGGGTIAFHWLCASWQVERWREALLWSFIVARLSQEPEPTSVLESVWSSPPCDRSTPDGLTFGESAFTTHRSGRAEEAAALNGHSAPLGLPGQPTPSCPPLRQCAGTWTQDQDNLALFKRLAWQDERCGDCCELSVHPISHETYAFGRRDALLPYLSSVPLSLSVWRT